MLTEDCDNNGGLVYQKLWSVKSQSVEKNIQSVNRLRKQCSTIWARTIAYFSDLDRLGEKCSTD